MPTKEELGIIDEVCYCGHLQSEHGSLWFDQMLIESGHGKCLHDDCGCSRYKFLDFVYKPVDAAPEAR